MSDLEEKPNIRAAKKRLVTELRALRREAGYLTSTKILSARVLVNALGGSDPDLAFDRFIAFGDEHAEDRDVQAALASVGWDVQAEAALDRLSEFGNRYDVDPRTVRRWSDAGIEKLAAALVGKSPWIQPKARLLIVGDETEVRASLELRIPPEIWMGVPELDVDGRPVALDMPTFKPNEKERRYRSEFQQLATLETLPVKLRLTWSGEKQPVYEVLLESSPGLVLSAVIMIQSLHCRVRRG